MNVDKMTPRQRESVKLDLALIAETRDFTRKEMETWDAIERAEKRDLERLRGYDGMGTRGAVVGTTGYGAPVTTCALPGDMRTAEYTQDAQVLGVKNEILPPQMSVEAWSRKRSHGNTGTDRDLNRYIAERMGLVRPSIETRALGEDTTSGPGSGSAIVPQQWSTSFIDIIRPNLALTNCGISTLPMQTEQYTYPQYLNDVAPAWVAEGQQNNLDANPQFSGLILRAQGAYMDITLIAREVAEDTNQAGGLVRLLQGTIGQKYARLIDQVGIFGTQGNSGNPGIYNESGLVTQSMGTNGAAPVDTTKPSQMAESVRTANAEPSAFLTNPSVYGTFCRLNASTYAKYWDWPRDVANVPWVLTTTMPTNETQGTSSACSSILAGPWNRGILGMRVDLQMDVLKERYADLGCIGIVSYMRFSFRLSHPETFVRLQGVLTT